MDTHIRDSWIAAGKTIQTFTKISNAKMQDVPRQNQISSNAEGGFFANNFLFLLNEQCSKVILYFYRKTSSCS